jgi:hypothetical protein
MFRLLSSPNPLLSAVVQFVNTKEMKFSELESRIKESSMSELVPAFAFLANWLAVRMNGDNRQEFTTLQSPFHLLGLITNRVPPIILLTGVFDLNWGMTDPHWLLSDFYAPINERLVRLRSYVKPLSMFMDFVPLDTTLQLTPPDLAPFSDSMIESEIDTTYEVVCRKVFEKLLLNHAPVDHFRQFFHYRNARSALTDAIIHLLSELNEVRSASHEELAFGFSTIFLYVHAFSALNEIDGQELCEFLQARPFLSPFCMLAIVNHIPSNLFLFNLLTPREMTRDLEHSEDVRPEQYVLVDLASRKRLTGFLDKIPTIMGNYFLSTLPPLAFEVVASDNDDEFLSFVHLSGLTLYNRMKTVLVIARERSVTCFHVCTMGIALLRCITHSLQRTLVDCLSQNVFTTTFCCLIRSVLALLCPTFSLQLAQKFLCFPQTADAMQTVDLTLRAMLHQTIPLLLASPTNDLVMQFCISGCRGPRTVSCARLLICKLFQGDRPKLSAQTLTAIEETEDGLLLLDFLDAMTAPLNVQSIQESERLHEQRQRLMKRLDITVDATCPEVFLLESFVIDKRRPSPLTSLVLSGIEQLSRTRPGKDVHDLLRKVKDLGWIVLRSLTLSQHVKNRQVSDLLVGELCHMLREKVVAEPGPASRFEMRPCDFALPVAQGFVGRLLLLGFSDLATKLVVEMLPVLAEDSAPLHWIVMFTSRYRSVTPPDILHSLLQLVSSLQEADSLFVTGEDRIYRLVNGLVERERPLLRDPEIVNREYPGPFAHAQAFAHCSLSLAPLDDGQVARIMVDPIFNLSRVWKDKEAGCLCLARLAASMCHEIAFQWFQGIMARPPGRLALSAARLFITRARLAVLRRICVTCADSIAGDPTKLDYFMRIVAPSYHRLRGGDGTAASLLCALLQSVNSRTPRGLQETVLDLVSFIYIKLKLSSARTSLINAASNFLPDLKALIPLALELTFSKG